MNDFWTSLRVVVVSIIVCCLMYPAAVWIFGRAAAPQKAQGELICNGQGQITGSALIAQGFSRPEYFWPRPSAASYNAAAASGSNLSPTSPLIQQRTQEIVQRLGTNGDRTVPADLVTASGSGLDPHISLAAAMFQSPRIAAARNLRLADVESLIHRSAENPSLEWFGGKPVINVLKLNLAMDGFSHAAKSAPKQE